jgi:hypothetical protein
MLPNGDLNVPCNCILVWGVFNIGRNTCKHKYLRKYSVSSSVLLHYYHFPVASRSCMTHCQVLQDFPDMSQASVHKNSKINYSATSEVGHLSSWLHFHGISRIMLIFTRPTFCNLATPISCNLSMFVISYYTFQPVYSGHGNFSCTSLYISSPTYLSSVPA